MKTLSNIKKDLEFNRGLSSLIEVLKTMAVAQYRILEERLKIFEKLIVSIEDFFEHVDITKINHPYLIPQNRFQGVVAITSDSGLLGGLNMQVVSGALLELEKTPGKLIIIGERGKLYVRETNIPFVSFGGVKDDERYAQAMQLRDYLLAKVLDGSFGSLKIIYPHPVSFTVQHVETVSFLPYKPNLVKENTALQAYPEVILESRVGDIMQYLVYTWMGQKIYEIFGLSRLAEFAARFVHLEGSHQRLREMDTKIKLEYFHVRHELIDRNMRELFAARLAFS
jgi:ATP synthase F1 gamma subunit